LVGKKTEQKSEIVAALNNAKGGSSRILLRLVLFQLGSLFLSQGKIAEEVVRSRGKVEWI